MHHTHRLWSGNHCLQADFSSEIITTLLIITVNNPAKFKKKILHYFIPSERSIIHLMQSLYLSYYVRENKKEKSHLQINCILQKGNLKVKTLLLTTHHNILQPLLFRHFLKYNFLILHCGLPISSWSSTASEASICMVIWNELVKITFLSYHHSLF